MPQPYSRSNPSPRFVELLEKNGYIGARDMDWETGSEKVVRGTATIPELQANPEVELFVQIARKGAVVTTVVFEALPADFDRLLPTLEAAVWMWLDGFGKGQLTVKVDTSDLGEQFGTLNRIGGMLTVGMILAGALIGLAIVTVMLLQPSVGDSLGPLPGIAAVMFIGLLLYALRQVRRFAKSISSDDEAL